MGVISLIIGIILAISANLRVLSAFGCNVAAFWDVAVTALVISAGTEGINSITKFLGYSKAIKKKEEEKIKS